MTVVRHIFVTLLALVLTAAVAGSIWLYRGATVPGPLTVDTLVYVPPGSSVPAITRTLAGAGVIADAEAFHIAARIYTRMGSLKAGEYNFPARVNVIGVLRLLNSGKTHQRRLTVPEGLTALEIVTLLREEGALSGEIAEIPAEGSLLPETYHFSYGDSRAALIGRMEKAMRETLAELWAARAENLPITTPEQAVTLASVVEKETGIAAERPRVAGVFVNRLNRGMPLQSDPTVIYAITMGKRTFDRPLLLRDLKTVSLYNTYAVRGLPPGPIANPGRASLAATLNPEIHDYIYFVADGTGGHAFATTLKDHNNNVARWRRLQKAGGQ